MQLWQWERIAAGTNGAAMRLTGRPRNTTRSQGCVPRLARDNCSHVCSHAEHAAQPDHDVVTTVENVLDTDHQGHEAHYDRAEVVAPATLYIWVFLWRLHCLGAGSTLPSAGMSGGSTATVALHMNS